MSKRGKIEKSRKRGKVAGKFVEADRDTEKQVKLRGHYRGTDREGGRQ